MLFEVLLLLMRETEEQRLDQFSVLLSSSERKVLLGHLDIGHLDGVFLTKRQGQALQEEQYLRWEDPLWSYNLQTWTFRSLGYEPFSAESDSLLTITESDVPLETNSAEDNRIPTDDNNLISLRPSLDTSSKQFTNLNLQFVEREDTQFDQKSAKTIESLLNRLSLQQQTRFVEQFARLNSDQQNYAYKQFISNPVEVQEFALKQFLTLDPEILIISIDREIEGEKNAIENQISNLDFSNSVNNEISNPNSNPVRQNRLIDQSQFQTNFWAVQDDIWYCCH